MRLFAPTTVTAALLLVCAQAQAQIVDEVDIRREGADAVLQVRFATEVQFQRAIATRSGDLVLVSYNLLSTTNNRLRTANQVLRLRAARGLPEIEVSDEVDRGEQARRLVLRFASTVSARVRAGRGNRSIEVVLKGLGAGLTPPAAAAAARPSTPPPGPGQATRPEAVPVRPRWVVVGRREVHDRASRLGEAVRLPELASEGLDRLREHLFGDR